VRMTAGVNECMLSSPVSVLPGEMPVLPSTEVNNNV
jgi:hypothetical protein